MEAMRLPLAGDDSGAVRPDFGNGAVFPRSILAAFGRDAIVNSEYR